MVWEGFNLDNVKSYVILINFLLHILFCYMSKLHQNHNRVFFRIISKSWTVYSIHIGVFFLCFGFFFAAIKNRQRTNVSFICLTYACIHENVNTNTPSRQESKKRYFFWASKHSDSSLDYLQCVNPMKKKTRILFTAVYHNETEQKQNNERESWERQKKISFIFVTLVVFGIEK